MNNKKAPFHTPHNPKKPVIFKGRFYLHLFFYLFLFLKLSIFSIAVDVRFVMGHFILYLLLLHYLNNNIAVTEAKISIFKSCWPSYKTKQIYLSAIKKISIQDSSKWRFLLYFFFIFEDKHFVIETYNQKIIIPCIGWREDDWDLPDISGTVDHFFAIARRNNIAVQDMRY